MHTQRFMGRNQLLERLTAQVGDAALAKELLIKRGHMTASGELTAEGQRRSSMTAEERAIDRASKRSGKPASHFTYNPDTNRATLLTRGR